MIAQQKLFGQRRDSKQHHVLAFRLFYPSLRQDSGLVPVTTLILAATHTLLTRGVRFLTLLLIIGSATTLLRNERMYLELSARFLVASFLNG